MKTVRVDFSELKKTRSPVFSLCRRLIEDGVKENTRLEVYRGNVLCLSMKLKDGAETSVVEPDRKTGCRPMYFAKYNPWWEKQTEDQKQKARI